jgi:hypothetical protein
VRNQVISPSYSDMRNSARAIDLGGGICFKRVKTLEEACRNELNELREGEVLTFKISDEAVG